MIIRAGHTWAGFMSASGVGAPLMFVLPGPGQASVCPLTILGKEDMYNRCTPFVMKSMEYILICTHVPVCVCVCVCVCVHHSD